MSRNDGKFLGKNTFKPSYQNDLSGYFLPKIFRHFCSPTSYIVMVEGITYAVLEASGHLGQYEVGVQK